jgi:hypothetical protein
MGMKHGYAAWRHGYAGCVLLKAYFFGGGESACKT